MKQLLVYLLLITIISCKKDNASKYAGTWAGSYTTTGTSSTDKGSWQFVIAVDGSITGSTTSFTNGYVIKGSGTVTSNGQLIYTPGLINGVNYTPGVTFTGVLNVSNANGEFADNATGGVNYHGTWTGTKQ